MTIKEKPKSTTSENITTATINNDWSGDPKLRVVRVAKLSSPKEENADNSSK